MYIYSRKVTIGHQQAHIFCDALYVAVSWQIAHKLLPVVQMKGCGTIVNGRETINTNTNTHRLSIKESHRQNFNHCGRAGGGREGAIKSVHV